MADRKQIQGAMDIKSVGKSINQMNILLHDDFKQSKVKEYNEGFLALRNIQT